jgi:hypothetical protein
MSPDVGRTLFGWVVFIVLLSGVMLLAGDPGTPAFAISLVTFGFGVVFGGVLVVLVQLSRRKE